LEGDVDLFVCRLISVVGGLNIEYKEYLDDITVELIRDGEVVKRISTRDGNYSFDGLGEGEYRVCASVYQNRAVVERPRYCCSYQNCRIQKVSHFSF